MGPPAPQEGVMARTRRIKVEGDMHYHVMSRTNDRRNAARGLSPGECCGMRRGGLSSGECLGGGAGVCPQVAF